MTDSPSTSDELAVRTALDAFYDAFEAMDMDAMSAVWARRDHDICVHPGWEILSGWDEIRESWRAIFANTGFMRFQASGVQVELLGDVARITNVENLFTVAGVHTAHSQIAATNLFLRTPQGWKLTLHHGSPMAAHHVVEELDPDEPAN